MTLPASGQLSLGDIATEKSGSLSNVSLTTESTTDINTNSPSFPDGIAPYAISEFYSYDHSAGGISYTTLTIDGTNTYTINTDTINTNGRQYRMTHETGSSQIIYSHRGASSAYLDVGGFEIDSNGAIQSVGTPTEVIPNVGTHASTVVDSSGRYIAVVRDQNASGYVKARLFDYDNSTKTVTLVGSLTNIYTGRTNNSVTDTVRISDSVVFAVSNRGNTGVGLHKITISGTTLSGATSYYTFNLSAGASTTKIMRTGTDDSVFIITQRRTSTNNRYIDYISATGLSSSPSYGTRTNIIDLGGEYINAQGATYIGNNYGLICYSESSVQGGDGKHHVALVSMSGTTLTFQSEITTTATSANDGLRNSAHDVVVLTTVGNDVYFVSKVAGVLAILGKVDTSTGTMTKVDEVSSFAPVDFFGSGYMINSDPDGDSTNLLILGNNGTTLTALTGSIS